MNLFTYKIVYFIIALFLGFFVGYILRRDDYEKKVQDDVYKKEKEFQDSVKNLEQINEKFIESENRLQINRDLYQTQKTVIEKIKDDIESIKQKTIASQEASQELEIKIQDILENISLHEKNINDIKPKYVEISNIIKENEDIELKSESTKEELKILDDKLASLQNRYKNLEEDFKKLDDLHNSYKTNIEKISSKIFKIKDKNNLSQSQTEDELNEIADALKVKVLNYKYKIEELEKNMQNGLKIDKEDLEFFVSKNEKERFIDRFLSKIFKFNQKDNR